MSNIGRMPELQNRNLVDQPNLQTRKMFIYKVKNQKDKGFIKEQAIAIMNIEFVKVINVVKDEQQTVITQVNIANNSKGNTASLSPRLGNMSYTTDEHFNEGDLYVVSLDEAVTLLNGSASTDLYFIDNIRESYLKPVNQHGKLGAVNPSDFTLSNIKDVVQNYQGLKFLFTFQDEINNPTKVDLSMDNYTLLSKVMAKGKVEGKKHQDIDLEIDTPNSTKMSLLTMSPTSTNYKLSMFSHWLDSNRTLAFVKAKPFITKTNLKTLFDTSNADFTGWSSTEIEDAYKVVIGMMKLTQAFATNFTEYRITDGKIDPTLEINGIKVVEFADKSPINAIDGMVEAWKSKYPGQVDSDGFKILLETIVMLSNHINSTYAIAKGNNDFMKVYLPWYFVPQTSINKTLADDGQFDVILKSEYFDFTQSNPLQIKSQYNDMSGYVAHDLNGWISQPELPNSITPINKFARPGDISTTNDDDLKYLFYIPFVDETILENLYGELHTTTTPAGWNDEGITRRFPKKTYTIEGPTFSEGTGTTPTIPTYTESDCIAIVQATLNDASRRVKAGSVSSITTTTVSTKKVLVSTVGTPGGGYGGIPNTFKNYYKMVVEYTLEFDYELQINGSTTISSVQHKGTIFDKLNWRSVANSLTNSNDRLSLSLIPNHKFNLTIEDIAEINIQAVWLDYMSLSISDGTNTLTFNDIELPSLEDESLTNISILW